MIRINSLHTPTVPGGFVVDEMLAPPSQVPLAVPVEPWLSRSGFFRRAQVHPAESYEQHRANRK